MEIVGQCGNEFLVRLWPGRSEGVGRTDARSHNGLKVAVETGEVWGPWPVECWATFNPYWEPCSAPPEVCREVLRLAGMAPPPELDRFPYTRHGQTARP